MPAGTYHVECDAVIGASIDISFALIWRRGVADTMLAAWVQHFEPLPSGLFAQPYEIDVTAPAIDFQPGDQLVFRYMGPSPADQNRQLFIPNGDGARTNGRIPSITLPQ